MYEARYTRQQPTKIVERHTSLDGTGNSQRIWPWEEIRHMVKTIFTTNDLSDYCTFQRVRHYLQQILSVRFCNGNRDVLKKFVLRNDLFQRKFLK